MTCLGLLTGKQQCGHNEAGYDWIEQGLESRTNRS